MEFKKSNDTFYKSANGVSISIPTSKVDTFFGEPPISLESIEKLSLAHYEHPSKKAIGQPEYATVAKNLFKGTPPA